MSKLKIYQVDAFTARPFSGNPAAVCLLDRVVDDAWMQALAREMNLSETAFLFRRQCEQPPAFDLRWFTPTTEVDLCGHATLAAAHLLWEIGELAGDEMARFHTHSGVLSATHTGGEIVLNFPADPPKPLPADPTLAAALGLQRYELFRGKSDLMVVLESERQLREMAPDMAKLREIECRGVIVTARAESGGYDFISRFFAPSSGIDEDPVTGSAHCTLAPYWAQKLASTRLRGYQASARGGEVGVELYASAVHLSGKAVTVFIGELQIDPLAVV